MATPFSNLVGTTPTEPGLLGAFLNVLNQQYGQAQQLSQSMLPYAGATPVMDAGGNVTGYNIAGAEADPTLLRLWNEQEQTLANQLQKQFGPGWHTSTGGSQTWNDFQAAKAASIESNKRAYQKQTLSQIMSAGNFPGNTALSYMPGMTQGISSWNTALNQDRALGLQQSAQSAQNWGNLGQGLGRLLTGPGGISGAINDIFGIPKAILGGAKTLGDLFNYFSGGGTGTDLSAYNISNMGTYADLLKGGIDVSGTAAEMPWTYGTTDAMSFLQA